MALIEDKRATPELRKNVSTAGPGAGTSGKKRIKKKFDFLQTDVEAEPSIGILEDESRVQQELGLDNFIQPDLENGASDYPTERKLVVKDDDSGYYNFKDLDETEDRHHFSQDIGGGLKSILDSAEKSSIINSDILSSDAKDFGFLKSGVGPMW